MTWRCFFLFLSLRRCDALGSLSEERERAERKHETVIKWCELRTDTSSSICSILERQRGEEDLLDVIWQGVDEGREGSLRVVGVRDLKRGDSDTMGVPRLMP